MTATRSRWPASSRASSAWASASRRGANFLGALLAGDRLGADAQVATVFPDDSKKYLSTDLMREEPLRPGFLSPEVQLLGFEAKRRACETCVDLGACGIGAEG
jgi:cysteine synthase A